MTSSYYACQASIDLAMRWVRLEALGIPKDFPDFRELIRLSLKLEPSGRP